MQKFSYPTYIDLNPTTTIQRKIKLPGSKSLSNRILLLAALSCGITKIKNLLISDDTQIMLFALQKLGINWEKIANTEDYMVFGGNGIFPVAQAHLFMGNAGTAIRSLTAVLAVLGGNYILYGSPRMHERPIGDLVHALNAVGAHIEYIENLGYPPLRICRSMLNAHHVTVSGLVSSQFLSALLIAAPLIAKNQDVIIDVIGELISKPYIDMTLHLMRQFGIDINRDGYQKFIVTTGQNYHTPNIVSIEGDASTASYFLAAGAISGSQIRVEGINQNSIQGDIQFVEVLRQMGAIITFGNNWIESSANTILQSIDADFNHIPDAAMTIAIVALYANGTSVLRNIASWRIKETDRLLAMTTELRKLGAILEEGRDYLSITPPKKIIDATIDTYDDHRMAMCFSLASLHGIEKRGACIRINNPRCVAKTFPDYFRVFQQSMN